MKLRSTKSHSPSAFIRVHLRFNLAVALLLSACATARAAMPSAEAIARLADDYLAHRVTPAFPRGMTMDDAIDVQRVFVKELQRTHGRRVGHKVGLVNREAQQRFGVEQPVRGQLLEKMLLPDHAEVSPTNGSSLLLEADLIVTVKDRAINKAGTPLEALRHLKDVAAFIELPDAFVATNASPDGLMLTAANAGARLGVVGTRVPVRASRDFADALAAMSVALTDEAGLDMGHGSGKAILDHPLNALLWLIEDLQLVGDSLQPGDVVSLGSIRAMPLPPAKSVTATYTGLPGGPLKVTVRIKP